jgi:hypothetical protein
MSNSDEDEKSKSGVGSLSDGENRLDGSKGRKRKRTVSSDRTDARAERDRELLAQGAGRDSASNQAAVNQGDSTISSRDQRGAEIPWWQKPAPPEPEKPKFVEETVLMKHFGDNYNSDFFEDDDSHEDDDPSKKNASAAKKAAKRPFSEADRDAYERVGEID